MPLATGKGKKVIGKNIRDRTKPDILETLGLLKRSGRSQKQSVAIALSTARKSKKRKRRKT
jgi:hypothetical protein